MGRRRTSETLDRDALARRVRNLSSTGMNAKDIGRHLSVDAELVGTILKTVVHPGTGSARDKRIRELHADGVAITSITGRMGCSIAEVQAALAKSPKSRKVKA